MERFRDFLVLRYSLVEEKQSTIDASPLPTPKGESVLVALQSDREFSVNGVVYGLVGFSYAEPTQRHQFPVRRFLIGKVAKLRQAHVGRKVPGDIVETQEDDWQPLLTIFDLHKQFIVIERDWRFGTPEQSIRALQGGLRNPIFLRYNHTIFIEGCVREEHFWKIVNTHKKIYKLDLKLISPNILETNLKARDALSALKDLFGQDQVNINLVNEKGDLNVPANPIEDYVEYIQEGEGTWAITTEGDHGGKKTHTSSENIDTIMLAAPMSSSIDNTDADVSRNLISVREKDAALVAEVFLELSNNYER